MATLTCVSYKNTKSVDGNPLADLLLGHQHHMVGSNKKKKRGDTVIIKAIHAGTTYFTVGEITDTVDNCVLWSDAGGCAWKYN